MSPIDYYPENIQRFIDDLAGGEAGMQDPVVKMDAYKKVQLFMTIGNNQQAFHCFHGNMRKGVDAYSTAKQTAE